MGAFFQNRFPYLHGKTVRYAESQVKNVFGNTVRFMGAVVKIAPIDGRRMPTSKVEGAMKKVPKFRSEKKEADFWATHVIRREVCDPTTESGEGIAITG